MKTSEYFTWEYGVYALVVGAFLTLFIFIFSNTRTEYAFKARDCYVDKATLDKRSDFLYGKNPCQGKYCASEAARRFPGINCKDIYKYYSPSTKWRTCSTKLPQHMQEVCKRDGWKP